MTNLYLLVTDLRHAELCVLGCKFVVRQYQGRAYPKHLAGLSRHAPTFFNHEFLPLLLSPR